jgi:hypothetical protein
MKAKLLSRAGDRSPWPGRVLEIASLGAYLACLFLPAFTVVVPSDESIPGWMALSFGWTLLVLLGSDESLFMCLAWFANVAFVAAQLSLLKRRGSGATACAAAGLVLSACFALVKRTSMQGMCMQHPVVLHVGYVLWVLSMLLALMSTIATEWRRDVGSLVMRYRKGITWFLVLTVLYVIVGLALPPGKCALLR